MPRARLKEVALVLAPQLVALPDGRITWTGVSNLTYTVQSSSNLTSWGAEDSAASTTSQFTFTNTSSASPRFFRGVYP